MKAAAFVVGPRDGAGAALYELARVIGFMPVDRYQGLARAERQAAQTPLVFFLCAAVPDVSTLRPIADAIRFSPSHGLRFAPLIYFARDPSIEAIRQCIQMGFDDIIALPYGAGDLGERVFRQVGRPLVYYETPTYFGPDRRNRMGEQRSGGSDRGGGEHRRIEILRSFEGGVSVLDDESAIMV